MAALPSQVDLINAQPTSGPLDPDFTQKLISESLPAQCITPSHAVCLHVVTAVMVLQPLLRLSLSVTYSAVTWQHAALTIAIMSSA